MPEVVSFLSIADCYKLNQSELKLLNGSFGIQTALNTRYFVAPKIGLGGCT